MPTLVTIKNIGRQAQELIDGVTLTPGQTAIIDLDDEAVRKELRNDSDYVILPDSAAGTGLGPNTVTTVEVVNGSLLPEDLDPTGTYVVGHLQSNGTVSIPNNGAFFGNTAGSEQAELLLGGKVGDATQRFALRRSGAMFYSDGVNAPDTSLARAGAGLLKIQDNLEVVEAIGLWGTAPPAAQPATPVDLAGVIAALQAYGIVA